MHLNTTWASRGTASNPVLKAGLIMFAALALVLAASGKAQAADCSTVDDCYNAAAWQKAIAQDYNNKGIWFQAAAKSDFVNAANWHNKSVGAFLSGDGNAAQWYQAIANDYARKAVANSKASNEYFAKAKFTAAAADGNVNRGMAITAFTMRGPEDSIENAAPTDVITTAGYSSCKNPRNREWSGGGIHVFAYVKNFCWHSPQEVTKVDLEFDSDVTGIADAQISEDGCHEERWWYAWNINYNHSGRKVLITCRFDAKPAGIVPITVATLTCRVALYFHSNGSYAYTKKDKMRCDKDLF